MRFHSAVPGIAGPAGKIRRGSSAIPLPALPSGLTAAPAKSVDACQVLEESPRRRPGGRRALTGRPFRIAILAGLGLLTAPLSVQAQEEAYPSRAIYLISGHPAGTGADVVARFFGKELSEKAGQPVIVENKPGAFTMMGIQYAAKAAPDGYTLHI